MLKHNLRPAMLRSRDWRPLYPFASHEISLDGHRYHYLDEGTGPVAAAGPRQSDLVVLLAGTGLAFRGRCRVVVPDHIGCGLSDKPSPERIFLSPGPADGRPGAADRAARAASRSRWWPTIGAGRSAWGRPWPARAVRPAGAAEHGGFPREACPWRIRLCHVPVVGQLGVQGLNLFARAALRMAVASRERMTPAVRAGLLAPYDSWGHRVAIYRFVDDIPLRPAPSQLSRRSRPSRRGWRSFAITRSA